MSAVRPLLGGAILAGAIAACTLTAPVTCPLETFDPPAPLTCEVAVDAARAQLASVAGVTALRFEYSHCPPNARCVFPDGATGNVIATLSDGRELGVFVGMDPDGVVQASEPALLPPTPLPAPAGG